MAAGLSLDVLPHVQGYRITARAVDRRSRVAKEDGALRPERRTRLTVDEIERTVIGASRSSWLGTSRSRKNEGHYFGRLGNSTVDWWEGR